MFASVNLKIGKKKIGFQKILTGHKRRKDGDGFEG
jgi:hypothetical protein